MEQLISTLDTITTTLYYVFSFWWIYTPFILILLFLGSIQSYTRIRYLNSLKWVFIELKLPRDTHKSPKATEQIFAALHTVSSSKKWHEVFFKGEAGDWFSFEIVSFSGDIHFYIRTLEKHRNLVESQIYAQYPEAEIFEVSDYMEGFPRILPDDKHDLGGGDLILEKEDAYPIRTYPEFEEEKPGKEDVKRIDPLASLSESLSILQAGEVVAIQLLIKSSSDKWVKEAQKVVEKLIGREPKVEQGLMGGAISGIDTLIFQPAAPAKEEKKDEFSMFKLTPGKQEMVKAIEKSITKLGFQTNIRFIYVAPRDTFNRYRPAGVTGAFKQFSSHVLNGFKVNKETSVRLDWPAPMEWAFKPIKTFRETWRKKSLYKKFKKRGFSHKLFVLNIEELATVYHFPDISVQTPLPRIEAKKGEAPVSLPTS